jgi:hypothetical protein
MSLSTIRTRQGLGLAVLAATAAATLGAASGGPAGALAERAKPVGEDGKPVKVDLLSPRNGDRAGIGSRGWFVDLAVDYDTPLAATGFTGEQLTGPGVHNNAAPFPGSFSAGQDDRHPGLIVLVATTQAKRADGSPTGFSGPGQNVANLFNLTGVTDRTETSTQISDTWIVGAPVFGRDTPSTVYAAVAADKNGDGVFNDAPSSVPDGDGDGDVDKKDLRAFGLASNVDQADFFIAD